MVEEKIDTFLLLSCTLQFSKEDNEKIIAVMYGKFLIHYVKLWKLYATGVYMMLWILMRLKEKTKLITDTNEWEIALYGPRD